ncbi:cilia- and flagella-associated protein 70 isoform X1 [Lepisosteus oculatus]|uniref:cilia- and flagella-associated protein 70 isoform X1 n=1 Tax=Lepisosteus oculatus TaxID=7918 RepID=UPI0035F50B17
MEQCQAGGVQIAVPVQLTVLRGRNLKGTKGESLPTFVRAEFNGSQLGDSQKLEAAPGSEQGVEYNFTCSFECTETGNTLDDLAQKPVLLTLFEILPKEKKQKEEKTVVLGQAAVDLLPLLHGQYTFTTTVILHPTAGSSAEVSTLEGTSKPALDVAICVPEPLLSDAQLADSNLLKVAVETAYSVPEVWNLAGPAFNCVAALQVPVTAEKEQLLLFSNGVLKQGGEREPTPRLKKWPMGPVLAPGAQFIPGAYIEAEPTEGEDGELTGVEDREFRADAECARKRVSWDTERRCFVEAGGLGCLLRRIADCRFWPVEIMRTPQSNTTKAGKTGKDKGGEDDGQISFHGVAYVDMAPLLYPGVKRIRGAYPVVPFYETDLLAKTKRQGSVLRDSLRQAGGPGKVRVPSSIGSPHCKGAPSKILKDEKGARDKEASKKTSTQPAAQKPVASESASDIDTIVPLNPEGQMYAEARTYVVIEIALDKPLVPKRPPEELAKRVAELIPPRPPMPRRLVGADRAVQDYHGQVGGVARLVLEQYQELFGGALAQGELPLDVLAQEERKTKLLGELNYSGKYFAFKEQMKYSVVRIVREKMLRTEGFSDREQHQAFLSQLYVFLVDEMHVALNKTLSVDVQESEPQPLLDCPQLKHFAMEAQINQDYQLAAQYYQERLARDRSNPAHWFDYGAFLMLTSDYSKAEECFHQAVALDQRHLPSLLLCGILAEMGGRHEDTETFFEDATCVDPSSVIAWTLFGLFYEGQENAIQAEMAFLEANKQLKAASQVTVICAPQAEDEQGTERSEGAPAQEAQEPAEIESDIQRQEERGAEAETESVAAVSEHSQGDGAAVPEPDLPVSKPPESSSLRPTTTIFMETVHFLLQTNALQMAQRALAQELLCPDGGPSSSYHVALARLHLQRGEFDDADKNLQEALQDSFENPDVWALSGHLHYLTGKFSKARQCYERTLDFVTDATDIHPIYLRLGTIYLQEKQFEQAKRIYLRACRDSPSCLTWLGLGIACYRLEELTEAEDALTEANTLHNANPEVWGYLSLVCLKTGRHLEAEQSYKYTIKLNLRNGALLQEIHELQERVGFGNPSF